MIKDTQCLRCIHFRDAHQGKMICSAYPNGIPNSILHGRHDHKYSYPGDHNVHYEPDAETSEWTREHPVAYDDERPIIALEARHLSPGTEPSDEEYEAPLTVQRDAEWAADKVDPPGVPVSQVMALYKQTHPGRRQTS